MMATNQAIQNRASSTFKEPKAKDPDTFDGVHPDRLTGFLMECELVFRLQASRFPTEDRKVLYITSYLPGIALDAVQPLLSSSTCSLDMESTTAFAPYLKASFGDPDKKRTARQKLRNLRQTGMASEYFAKFRELIAVLGWVDQNQ